MDPLTFALGFWIGQANAPRMIYLPPPAPPSPAPIVSPRDPQLGAAAGRKAAPAGNSTAGAATPKSGEMTTLKGAAKASAAAAAARKVGDVAAVGDAKAIPGGQAGAPATSPPSGSSSPASNLPKYLLIAAAFLAALAFWRYRERSQVAAARPEDERK